MKPFVFILYVIGCLVFYHILSSIFPSLDTWIRQVITLFVPALVGIYLSKKTKRTSLRATEGGEAISREHLGDCFVVPPRNDDLVSPRNDDPRSFSINIKDLGLVLLLSIVVSLLVSLMASYWNVLFPMPEINKLVPKATHVWEKPMRYIIFGLLPALCEETLFRGFLQNAFQKIWRPSIAIGVTSCIFACAHFNFWYFPFYFLLGIFFGWCFYFRGRLSYSILAHWVNNIIALILIS